MRKLFLFLFCFVTSIAFAQNKSISGTVLDENGAPILGAAVVVGDGRVGTTTDIDGNFNLTLPASGAEILSVFYMGYTTVELPIGSKSNFRIQLEVESTTIEDVVVVGYGQQKKVSVTGSVAAVTTESILETPSSNLVGTLTGKLPGLTITQTSGQPGAEDFVMRLRGASTVNGKNPLVLVDGVPRDSNISMMDPNEIESISILKDASATAVFGVRGANGVVLITTKSGGSEPSLNVTAEFGLQSNTREYDAPDSWEFAVMRNQALENDGFSPQYSARQIQMFKDGSNPAYYPNTDWYNLTFKDYAPMTRANVNYSGSTKRVNYFANVGFVMQDGLYKTGDPKELGYDPSYNMNRYNFRTNLDVKLNSWIKVGVKLAGYIAAVNEPYAAKNNSAHFYGQLYKTNSTIPNLWAEGATLPNGEVLQEDLYFVVESTGGHPYAEVNSNGFRNNATTNLNSTFSMDFDLEGLTKGLKAKLQYSFDTYGSTLRLGANGNANAIGGQKAIWAVNEVIGADGVVSDEITTDFSQVYLSRYVPFTIENSSSFRSNSNLQFAINYDRTFGDKHNVTGMVLGQYDDNEAASGESVMLLPYRRLGVSARGTYNYDYRYLAEFNMGYNGSEQFAEGKRFGFFPAGSLGWVVSNEKFLKDSKLINNLKLRASYGMVGSDNIGSERFLYLDKLSILTKPTDVFNPTLGQVTVGGAGSASDETLIGNKDLTWEIAYKQNYGIDLGMYNNNIRLSVDYFTEDRQNMLITPTTQPTILGKPTATVAKQNAGRVFNSGFETELFLGKQFTKDLYVSVNGSMTYAKNKVLEHMDVALGDDYAYPYRLEGFPIGQKFGYLIDWESQGNGYFVSQQEISKYNYTGTQPRLGDFVYQDLNGDGNIDDKDLAPIGNGAIPLYTYSFGLNVNYKGFDLSALFYGAQDIDSYFYSFGIFENTMTTGSYYNFHKESWTMERYATGQEINYPALATGASSSLEENDFFITDSSYIRLKNVELGYTLPRKLSKQYGINKFRVYINGSNLWTHDNLPFDHFDPEFTRSVVPITRTVNVGVNISL